MTKKAISSILTGVIVVLIITIVVLVVKIKSRPVVLDEKDDKQIVNEIIASSDTTEENKETVPEVTELPEEVPIQTSLWVRVTQNVNVRKGPGTENERIGSAYVGNELELVEQLDSGWSKVIYDGSEAYIHSDYLEVFDKAKEEQPGPDATPNDSTPNQTGNDTTGTQNGELPSTNGITPVTN